MIQRKNITKAFKIKQISNFILLVFLLSCNKIKNTDKITNEKINSFNSTKLINISFKLDSNNLYIFFKNKSNELLYIPLTEWLFFNLEKNPIQASLIRMHINVFAISQTKNNPFNGYISGSLDYSYKNTILNILEISPNQTKKISLKIHNNDFILEDSIKVKYLHLIISLFNSNDIVYIKKHIKESKIFDDLKIVKGYDYIDSNRKTAKLKFDYNNSNFLKIFNKNSYYILANEKTTIHIKKY